MVTWLTIYSFSCVHAILNKEYYNYSNKDTYLETFQYVSFLDSSL